MRNETKFNENNTWTYQNGELYHYGRPGMKWGKTIFGGIDNPKSLIYDPNYGKGRFPFTSNSSQTTRRERPSSSASERVNSKINNRPNNSGSLSGRKRPSASAAERIASRIPNSSDSKINNASKHGIRGGSISIGSNSDKTRNGIKDIFMNMGDRHYKEGNDFLNNRDDHNRYSQEKLFKDESGRSSYLESAMDELIQNGEGAYAEMMTNSRVKSVLNLSIQNAKYDLVSGLNDLVNKLGIGKQVDSVLNKFIGNKNTKKSENANGKVSDEPYSYDQGKPMTKEEYEAKRSQDYKNMYYRSNPTGSNSNSQKRKEIEDYQSYYGRPYIQVSGEDKPVYKSIRDLPGSATPYSENGWNPDEWEVFDNPDGTASIYNPHDLPTYEAYQQLQEKMKDYDKYYREKYWDDWVREQAKERGFN